MGAVRALWRGLRVVGLLLLGAVICVHIELATRLGRPPVWVARVTRWWFRQLLAALGVRAESSGSIEPASLLVANHVSWLDIPLLGAQGELTFLSKADVRRWPVIGWMCAVVGTEFIERGGNQVNAVVERISGLLANGRTVVIFPEGTTTDGDRVARFHPRLFAAVQKAGLRVQPTALSYHHGGNSAPDTGVAFVGDQTLVANLLAVLRHSDLRARVGCLPSFVPIEGEDRRALATRARSEIVAALGLERPATQNTAPNGTESSACAAGPGLSLACRCRN